ncbi:MAG: ATPase [Muribaculaceae bacterium]|nr:ATPase [Muribaculaceae bacterium]
MKDREVILIADAGSTKTDWCLIERSGRVVANVKTEGINAAIATADQMSRYLQSAKRLIKENAGGGINPDEVFYYGAGCASDAICQNVEEAIANVWGCDVVEVASDMLGACRALLGKEPGVACILGTGSNSALYDGKKIIANTPPLGYILGDEGSGAVIGKRFISDIFKGCAPEHIVEEFLEKTGLTKDEVIRRVYREPNANRFLASFAPYIAAHIDEEYFRTLVLDQFADFIRRNILHYSGATTLPISFIGSIAEHFSHLLGQTLNRFNLTGGKILSSPMPGLISYHSNISEL